MKSWCCITIGSNLGVIVVSLHADIVSKLKPYNVASVVPQIVDPEITSVLLTSTVKYDTSGATKSSDTLKSDIITKLTDYNTSTLQKFDSVFRYSKVVKEIDDADVSILSNITTTVAVVALVTIASK